MKLNINNTCNQNCIACSRNKKNVLSFHDAHALMNRKYNKIVISGGEPILSPEFFKYLSLFKRHASHIELHSNGVVFAYNDLAKKTILYGVDTFSISLPSLNPVIDKKITGTDYFHNRINGINNLCSLGADVSIYVNVNSLNYKELPEYPAFIKMNYPSIRHLYIDFISSDSKDPIVQELTPAYDEVKPFLINAIKSSIRHGIYPNIDNIPLCYLNSFESVHNDFHQRQSGMLSDKRKNKLDQCIKCNLSEFCFGVRKEHQMLWNDGSLEVHPVKNNLSSKLFECIQEDYSFNLNFFNHLKAKKTEPTKYFFTSFNTRYNRHTQCTPEQIKSMWSNYNKTDLFNGNVLSHFFINIPFCESKCHYCMYPSSINAVPEKIDGYINEIKKEILFYEDAFKEIKFSSIFVGGGSPSILTADQISDLFGMIFSKYTFSKTGEKTFECNPRHLTYEKLVTIKKTGFNRVTFGVQSLDPGILSHINRSYQSIGKVKTAILDAKRCGLTVNVDLMIGFINDTPGQVKKNCLEMIKLGVDSIALYPLKPPAAYLHKYYSDNEDAYYHELKNKISVFMKISLVPFIFRGYLMSSKIEILEGYCGMIRKVSSIKWYGLNKRLLDSEVTSCLGIGSGSVSKIFGVARYWCSFSEDFRFQHDKNLYGAISLEPENEMKDIILDCMVKKYPLKRKSFKKIFGNDPIRIFPYQFLALSVLKKIKTGFSRIRFKMSGDLADLYSCGLFFADNLCQIYEKEIKDEPYPGIKTFSISDDNPGEADNKIEKHKQSQTYKNPDSKRIN